MITQTVLGFLIDIILGIVAKVVQIAGAPVNGSVQIPSPLVWATDVFLQSFTAIFPALLIWFIWRQIKA
jgi:hypothetical protein